MRSTNLFLISTPTVCSVQDTVQTPNTVSDPHGSCCMGAEDQVPLLSLEKIDQGQEISH